MEGRHGDLHGAFRFGFRAGHFLLPRTQFDARLFLLAAQNLTGGRCHRFRVYVAHDAQQHISRRVKRPVTGIQHLRGDLPDGLAGAENGLADGMDGIHSRHQVIEHHAVRGVLVHADLLIDDAPLFLHAFFREIGRGHEFQQQPQTFVKVVCAGKIIGRHVVAGKGVGGSAQSGKLRRHVPVSRQVEHLVLQIVGNTRGGVVFLPVQPEIRMDGAKVRDKIGKLFRKALPGNHQNRQSVFQCFPVQRFVQFGVLLPRHWLSPFRK